MVGASCAGFDEQMLMSSQSIEVDEGLGSIV